MKPFRRVCALLLVCLFAATTLAGCGNRTQLDPAEEFLSYLSRREYPRIYKLLSTASQSAISLADMSDRFNEVYDAVGVTEVTGTVSERHVLTETSVEANVLVHFQTELLGEMELAMVVRQTLEDGTWRIEWSPSLILPGLEEEDTIRVTTLSAKRGEIFDADGNLLATNKAAESVYVDMATVTDLDTLLRLAAPILGMTEEDIRKKIYPGSSDALSTPQPSPSPTLSPDATPAPTPTPTPDTRQMVVKSYEPGELTEDIKEQLLAIPGIGIEDKSYTIYRHYPYGRLLSHGLGYVGAITAEDMEDPNYANISTDALVGRSGLEKAYDLELQGVPGKELAIYGEDGQKKTVLARKEAVNGNDLWLSVEADLQQQAETLLMDNLTEELSGTVIVMDPTTGAVQVMASGPSYDNNIFSFGVSAEDWAYLNDEANQLPLFNRATIGLYPPGSVFKPFTGGMGLESGAITLDYAFDSSQIHNNAWTPSNPNWSGPPIRRVTATVGALNLQNAMIYSDNIFFADVAMRVGEDTFIEYCKKYGMEEAIGGDLAVSTPRISNSGSLSGLRLLADSGYGQGEILISPLQMSAMFGCLANDGNVMEPHLVSTLRNNLDSQHYGIVKTVEPKVWREHILQSNTLSSLVPMLEKVVSSGTATRVYVPGLDICGKTGTAQVGADNSREIAWFIGFTSSENYEPRLVCVMIDGPAEKGSARYSIAKAMFEAIKQKQDDAKAAADPNRPSPTPERRESNTPTATPNPNA